MQCRIYLSIYVSIRLSFYPSVYLSILLSFFVSSFLCNSASVSLSLCVTNAHQHTCIMHVYIMYLFIFIHSFIYSFIYLFIYLLSLSPGLIIIITSLCYLSFSIRKLSCCADQTMFLAESCDANESAVFFFVTVHCASYYPPCCAGPRL